MQTQHKEQHWMMALNIAKPPAEFASKQDDQPSNRELHFAPTCNKQHMSDEQKKAVRELILPHLEKENSDHAIYKKIVSDPWLKRSDGSVFSVDAIKHHIASARKFYGIPKPIKQKTKTDIIVDLIKAGHRTNYISAVVGMCNKQVSCIKSRAINRGLIKRTKPTKRELKPCNQ